MGKRLLVILSAAVGMGVTAPGHAAEIATSSGLAQVLSPGAVIPLDYVSTPGGWTHPSCIHEVPNGATVEENGDVLLNGTLVAHYEPCVYAPIRTFPSASTAPNASETPAPQGVSQGPASYGGWIENTAQSAPTGQTFSEVYGRMVVPNNPTQNGSTLYYFNGIQSTLDGNCGILQPVLQWGVSPAGGGNYWSIGAWWWSNTNQYHSGLTTVYTGDHLELELWQFGQANNKQWGAWIYDDTRSTYQSIGPATTCRFDWSAPAVLEVDSAHQITNCNQISRNLVDIYSIVLKYGYPSWTLLNYAPYQSFPIGSSGPSCGWDIGSTNVGHTSTLWSTTLWQGNGEPTGCDYLASGNSLVEGQSLSSCDGRFVLVMQNDGNLVLYMGATPLWAMNAVGAAVVMQTDGNLVDYDANGNVVFGGSGGWSLPSNTQGWTGAYASVQDDGNFVVYSSTGVPIWQSGTCCH